MPVALAVLFSTAAVIAGTTGKISGKVLDAGTKEPLIGANVLIENTVMGASTDADGEYYILNIPPGSYSVVVRMIGYTSQRMENISVTVDLTAKADFKLKSTVIETKESVVVMADRTKVQKDLTSSERSMGSREIDQMPVRSVEELVKLQAGVVRDASGNLHIRGGR
jgi:isoaspartyl peptidase/L-asparaginase-like protein (Ntn-hydrolase superfamily)